MRFGQMRSPEIANWPQRFSKRGSVNKTTSEE